MLRDVIEKQFLEMLEIRLAISAEKSQFNCHLFGTELNYKPRILIYIYFFIQEEFSIKIDNKYILDGSFSTMNNIVDIIHEAVQVKEQTAYY